MLSLRKEQVLHVQIQNFLMVTWKLERLRNRTIAHWSNITIIGMFDIVT